MNLAEISKKESGVPVSFRASSEIRGLMVSLGTRLDVKPTVVPRIAILILNDLLTLPKLTEAIHRAKVYDVLHAQGLTGNVLQKQGLKGRKKRCDTAFKT